MVWNYYTPHVSQWFSKVDPKFESKKLVGAQSVGTQHKYILQLYMRSTKNNKCICIGCTYIAMILIRNSEIFSLCVHKWNNDPMGWWMVILSFIMVIHKLFHCCILNSIWRCAHLILGGLRLCLLWQCYIKDLHA